MKRALTMIAFSFVLCATLFFGFGKTEVAAETYGDLTYTVTNGEVKITGCDQSATAVDIPLSINGYPVTSIGDYAFHNCRSITSVSIPESVTYIGEQAFNYCWNLTGIYITDMSAWCNISFGASDSNPLYFADNLYLNGTLVTELTIPNSVTNIGMGAFYGCSSLTSIIIPDFVKVIDYSAFAYCTNLTSVSIGNGVTSIGDYSFFGCRSLENISIGNSVTSIGSYAFQRCTNITLHIPCDSYAHVYAKANSVPYRLNEDIDGDGAMTNRDATLLVRYLAKWDLDFDMTYVDLTGDGRINNRDIIALLQKLAGRN